MNSNDLIMAIENGDELTVALYVQSGVSLSSKINGLFPIEHAIKSHSCVLPLLFDFGATATVPDLFLAVEHNNMFALDTLLNNGLTLEDTQDDGPTVLSYASCSNSRSNIQQHIISRGARVSRQDSNQATALIISSWFGADVCVNNLLSAGAKVDISDSLGDTALIKACRFHHVSIAQTLLKAGATPGIRNHEGKIASDYMKI